jgi:hypothetical protein
MKKLMFAFFIFCGGVVAVNAQDSTSTGKSNQYPTQGQAASMDDQDREKINSRDLPDAVKRSLEGQEYRGWLVNAAYKSKGVSSSSSTTGSSTGSSSSSSSTTDDQSNSSQGNRSQGDSTSVSGNGNGSGAYAQEAYVVELKNGAQTKTVRFDKDGKKLDDAGMKNDQDKK